MSIIRGRAYEASMSHGCRAVDEAVAMQGVAYYQDMYVPVPDIDAAIEFGERQHGKDYDFPGAFGLPFLQSENWQDESKWWCSELNFAQIGAGGLWLLDPDEKTRVTPNDLRQCNYPKSPILKPASAGFFTTPQQ
ncbi:hypothetical protein D3871_11180 [Noviherbaspirillum saxi]|uniref:Uncharacterized protein n=2 Tax=Noviherbaspirillum saxi TaxID=2320863 RepID=A0A3A3FS20_9BURK|nr:hypothetical protein D3871_11180 [Noviherbaspirillum saxi]